MIQLLPDALLAVIWFVFGYLTGLRVGFVKGWRKAKEE